MNKGKRAKKKKKISPIRGTGPAKHLTVERGTSHTEFPEGQV